MRVTVNYITQKELEIVIHGMDWTMKSRLLASLGYKSKEKYLRPRMVPSIESTQQEFVGQMYRCTKYNTDIPCLMKKFHYCDQVVK